MTSPTSDECHRMAEEALAWAEEETDTSARKDLRLIALCLAPACQRAATSTTGRGGRVIHPPVMATAQPEEKTEMAKAKQEEVITLKVVPDGAAFVVMDQDNRQHGPRYPSEAEARAAILFFEINATRL